MNTDAICGALSVSEDSEILMITSKGQAVRCPVLNIRETNRGSKGVKLVNLSEKDKLIGISEVVELDEETSPDEETSVDVSKEHGNDVVPDGSPTELIDTEASIDVTDQNSDSTQDEVDTAADEGVVDQEE